MSETFSFEQAYQRLEAILEQMNTGKLSLDASLKFYEEADRLIRSCTTQLSQAEQKIETLIRSREGQLQMSDENTPLTHPFSRTP